MSLHVAKDGITRDDIRHLVACFYDRVRRDPRLGPIFHNHVGQDDAAWAPHLAKIEDFWANVMLKERSYDGNPMQVHMAIAEIRTSDFDIWLGLFHRVAREELSPGKADAFIELSSRIGRSLSMGLERTKGPQVPNLVGWMD